VINSWRVNRWSGGMKRGIGDGVLREWGKGHGSMRALFCIIDIVGLFMVFVVRDCVLIEFLIVF
jgi:hypothetical protein